MTGLLAGAILPALILAVLALGRAPPWLGTLYAVMGLGSAILYALDKRAAARGAWRVRESTLHLVDLGGGIAGGLLAQSLIRHKTGKPGFRSVSWSIVVLHAILLLALLSGLIDVPKAP